MNEFKVFRTSLQIKRKTTGMYVNGHWQEGAETSFTIYGDVQPTNPNDMDQLPEGRRINDTVTVYTDTLLNSIDGTGQNPDIVIYEGNRYEVLKSYHWRTKIIPHYKLIIGKCAQGQ